ncbi:hypothetical protein E2562_007130 [Oryza meyeriana var. granulata]|uniref:Uncharacterized protein n=1 Tax=Oryza meyeriana var. granulata TaxID=110450 RepID=A0A6G1CDP6_9ORYZ|nr:hypothetical protein E2562_007130 [Oryza meyeriana var. granulata]
MAPSSISFDRPTFCSAPSTSFDHSRFWSTPRATTDAAVTSSGHAPDLIVQAAGFERSCHAANGFGTLGAGTVPRDAAAADSGPVLGPAT